MSYIISGENKLPWKNYKPFFHMNDGAMNMSHGVNMFPVFCKLCGDNKIVKAHKSSSCNLKRHMINRHPSYMRDVEVIRKRYSSSSSSGQVKIESSSTPSVLQASCDRLVVRFVTGALLPTHIVENREFLELVHGLQQTPHASQSRATVLNHATLVNGLVREAQEFRGKVKLVLRNISYVATTIDVWHNQTMRNFIGITAQWIAPDTLLRKSVFLACRHITYVTPGTSSDNGSSVQENNIALLIDSVNREFGIQDKVVLSTIDNGSNQIFMYPGTPRTNLSLAAFTGFIPLKSIMRPFVLDLPPTAACVVNVIHAMGIYDARDAECDSGFNFQMKTLLQKCRTLWQVATLNSENVERCTHICGLNLVAPINANWKMELDCFVVLLKVHETRPDALRECCVALNVPILDDIDLVFLREYCTVMKPLASALDVLIGPNALYMGVLLPTVHSLKRRLEVLAKPPPPLANDNMLIYCRPLAEALLHGLEIRFNEKWFHRDLVLAAVLHPNFQLSWIKDPQLEQVALTWLREEVVAFHSSTAHHSSDDASSPTSSSESHDLFDFVRPSSEITTDEVDAFLAYPSRDLSCLHSLPTLKTLFIKYNTAVPSSAAADRVFGVNGALFSSPDHNIFTDPHYEELIIGKLKNTFQL